MLFRRSFFTWLLFMLAGHHSLTAWWDAGHMAVAQIAYEELNPHSKEKVDDYLKTVSADFPHHATFVTASLWADDLVGEGVGTFFSWHISSYPYDPQAILTEAQRRKLLAGIQGHDVVWLIHEAKKTLSNPKASSWAKGFMLRFLIHMVGDVHQPLHCASLYSPRFPHGDAGGTRFPIAHPDFDCLHKLFDGAFGLCNRRPKRPVTDDDLRFVQALVTRLKGDFPREDFLIDENEEPDRWREESYEIAVGFAYGHIQPNTTLSPQLIEEGKAVTGRRLALAGYRLGALLNHVLSK